MQYNCGHVGCHFTTIPRTALASHMRHCPLKLTVANQCHLNVVNGTTTNANLSSECFNKNLKKAIANSNYLYDFAEDINHQVSAILPPRPLDTPLSPTVREITMAAISTSSETRKRAYASKNRTKFQKSLTLLRMLSEPLLLDHPIP